MAGKRRERDRVARDVAKITEFLYRKAAEDKNLAAVLDEPKQEPQEPEGEKKGGR
jgi:hypothetical protein